jgi:hypothetical protein
MRRILIGFTVVVAVLGLWIATDLLDRSRHSLRDFDPHEVARLETRMWRSYYNHRSFRLFADLVTLLRDQYHLPFWKAAAGAYHAAHGAVVFQRGHERPDYLLALPDIIRYYELVRAASAEPFPVQRVSEAELEWWIVHRQRDRHARGDLAQSLAEEQARLFRRPAGDFTEHAGARAEAMRICDDRASAGASEEVWAHIQEVLDRSWTSLHTVVNR